MSGILLHGFHEGNRSEHLANYLLSGLGIVNSVPRQNDIGFDFYCHLANEEKEILSFDYPFLMQIKSDSDSSIVYGNSDSDKWKKQNLDWIDKLQTPLLFGFVSKTNMEIAIFTASGYRFLQIPTQELGFPDPSLVEFKRRKEALPNHITWPVKERIANWPDNGKGDGLRYTIDLGNPLITINNEDIFDKELLKRKKQIIRKIVLVEQRNLLFKTLQVPQIYWATEINTNEDFEVGQMFSFSDDKLVADKMLTNLAPAFISLATSLKSCNEDQLANAMKPLLKKIPQHIPEWMKDKFPNLLD